MQVLRVQCEDIILHCTLHGELNAPTIEDEHALRKRLADFAVDRNDFNSRAWNRQRNKFVGSRYTKLHDIVNGVVRGDVINDPVTLHLVSHKCLAHLSLFSRESVWTTSTQDLVLVPLRFAQMANGTIQPVTYKGSLVQGFCDSESLPVKVSKVCEVDSEVQRSEVCEDKNCEGCWLESQVQEAQIAHGDKNRESGDHAMEIVMPATTEAEGVVDVPGTVEGSVMPTEQESNDESDTGLHVDETVKGVPCSSDEDEAVSVCVFVHHDCVVNEDLFDDEDFGSDLSDEVVEPLPFAYEDSCDEDFVSDLSDEVVEPLPFAYEDSCDKSDQAGVPFMDKAGGVAPTNGCVEIEDLGDDAITCVTDAHAVDLFPDGNPVFELCSCGVKLTDCASFLQDGVYLDKTQKKSKKRRHRSHPAHYACQPKRYVRRNFQCHDCDKCFRYQHTVKAHCLRVHKKVPCHFTHCLEVFVMHSIMLAHAQTHMLKRYECATCKKVFKHMSTRDCHAVQHSTEATSNVCALCEKRYVRPADLLHHERQVHVHVKHSEMFVCADCGKKFKTRRQLGYHSKVHKDKQIKCSQCDELFCHYQARKHHMEKIHN